MRKLRKILLLLCATLFWVPLAAAQFTIVTGTVQDVNGVPYAGGTISASLVVPGGTAPTLNGVGFTGSMSPIGLDSTGSFTARLADNNVVLPSGTQWKFLVNITGAPRPLGTGPQTCTATLTITGASQSVSSNFSACPALGASGPGVGGGASPVMGFYLSPNCPTVNLGQCFYTPANVQQANDCSWTSGSPTVNCATSHFVPADTGKRAFGYFSCAAFIDLSINNQNDPISTGTALTLTYVSGTQVTLSGNAGQTVATNIGCFIWGTPDDAGASAVDTAIQSATQCPRLFLPAGYYLFTTPHFVTQPTACANAGPNYPHATTAGNMLYAAGFELEGRGTGPTTIYITPGFPETGACTNGLSGRGCFVVPTEGRWSHIQMTGGGNFNATSGMTNKTLLEVNGPASLDNFTCINFASQANGGFTTVAIGTYLWAQLYQINVSGCGTDAIATNVSSSVTAIKVSIDNPESHGWNIGFLTDYYTQSVTGLNGGFDQYNLTCYDCLMFMGLNMKHSATVLFDNQGLSVKFYHARFSTYFQATTTGNIGYFCAVAGCKADFEDSFVSLGSTASNIAVDCPNNCTNTFKDSTINATGAGAFGISDTAGSTENDLGGNTFSANNSILGKLFGSNSITGTTQTAGNFTAGAGLGTSTFGTVSGSSIHGQVTVTYAGTLATPATWTMTFPTTFLAAPSCEVVAVGGTNAFPTQIDTTNTPVTVTTLTVKMSFAAAPTAANTNTFVWNCSN